MIQQNTDVIKADFDVRWGCPQGPEFLTHIQKDKGHFWKPLSQGHIPVVATVELCPDPLFGGEGDTPIPQLLAISFISPSGTPPPQGFTPSSMAQSEASELADVRIQTPGPLSSILGNSEGPFPFLSSWWDQLRPWLKGTHCDGDPLSMPPYLLHVPIGICPQ